MQFSTLKENFERQLRKFILLCEETPLSELTLEERDSSRIFYQFEDQDGSLYIVIHDDVYSELEHRNGSPVDDYKIDFNFVWYEYDTQICNWMFFKRKKN